MNINLSYNWIKEYLKTSEPAKDFSRRLSLASQTVDRIVKTNAAWQKVITAKIIKIKPHPNANKLKLVLVDSGKAKSKVVCGAPNIKVGQIVPLALDNAVLVNPEDEDKTIKVGKAKIRGIESCGMLCSLRELGIGQDHTGIMILPQDTKIGVPLEKVYPINDEILEIEVSSNRPDCLSVIGIAREASAIINGQFLCPTANLSLKVAAAMPLKVTVQDKKLCPRYQAIVMTDVKVGPSPPWMQQRLLAAGLRPINNLVDITNYVLLEYGQPMHVFDYDKLALETRKDTNINTKGTQMSKTIIVRRAKRGEKILALDGNTYEVGPENLVIADAKKPVAIAGVMGGELSAVTKDTNTIVFESANFEPVQVRKTARALNLFSDSSNLFEKGLNIESPRYALLRAIELTQQVAKGRVASKIFDVAAMKFKPNVIKFNPDLIQRYLGIKLAENKVKIILKKLGFQITGQKIWQVTVPWWRTEDILYDYDLIEEIARIYGYHNLPVKLPAGEIPQALPDQKFGWEDRTKSWLVGLGFIEVYSYSLVSEKMITAANFLTDDCLKLLNPLSADFEYLRPTLIAGILKVVADNQKNFFKQKIFELSNVYIKKGEKDLPDEELRLCGALYGHENLFFETKGIVEFLLNKWQINGYKIKLTDRNCPIWQVGQAIDIFVEDKYLGQLGLVNKAISEKFDLQGMVAIFDFDFEKICQLAKIIKYFEPLPEYPAVVRDLAIVINNEVIWQKLKEFVLSYHPLIRDVEFLSCYTDESLERKKSLAFRIEFRADNRTLKSKEVDEVIAKLLEALNKEFDAKLR